MTGVIKSNRCGTCRKRKVKCDEVKPVCGPCFKGRRSCEAPISKVKFVKPKCLSPRHLDRPGLEMNRRAMVPAPAVPSPPSISSTEALQAVLIETFSGYMPGLDFLSVARFVEEIPRRIGHSIALDDAVTCLVHRSLRLLHGEHSPSRQQSNLYMKAVSSLGVAIDDPVEGFSENTLCAVALMSMVEILGGGAPFMQGQGYIMHAGGIARLIQIRGPDLHRDGFAKLLYTHGRGPAAAEAISCGTDCFLNEQAWTEISLYDLPLSPIELAKEEIIGIIIALPTLLKEIRQMNTMEAFFDPADVLKRAQNLRRTLTTVGGIVDQYFQNGVDVWEVPSAYGDEQVPIVYDFSSKTMAHACVMYWSLSSVLESIIAQLLPLTYPQAITEAISARLTRARQQICMSFEYSLRYWPLGSVYIITPLLMTYQGGTQTQKDWMRMALWKVSRSMPNHTIFYSPEQLDMLSNILNGNWSPSFDAMVHLTELTEEDQDV